MLAHSSCGKVGIRSYFNELHKHGIWLYKKKKVESQKSSSDNDSIAMIKIKVSNDFHWHKLKFEEFELLGKEKGKKPGASSK